jgi:hypothetical protein
MSVLIKQGVQLIGDFLERRPGFGIIASITGLGTSVLSVLHAASIVLGCGGALFGLLAGFYTWRIKKLHWERLNHELSKVSKP